MNTHAKLRLLVPVIGLAAVLGGCGGGGSDSAAPSSGPSPATTTGKFVDAAVGNLEYTCGTAPNQTSGKTDGLGVYLYVPGPPAPTCTFSIGGVTLGSATAGNVLTPYSLVPGSTPGTPNATVTNIARFLQSLDSDGNPANGITIADATATALTGKTLNFAATDFDAAFATAVAGTSLAGTTLVSAGNAASALDLTLVGLYSGDYKCTYSGTINNVSTVLGNVSISIGADGTVSGSGFALNNPGITFTVTGTVVASGASNIAGGGTSDGATFSGLFMSDGTVANTNGSGTWLDLNHNSGTWSCQHN
ncbi:MAG TPA: hypothetical protein VGH34_18160 [Vicinamibacterales bacterium]